MSAACVSTAENAISHTKLFVFSSTATPEQVFSTNVVWFGSANQTQPSGTKTYNNTVTIYGDAPLYTAMRLGVDVLPPGIGVNWVAESYKTSSVRLRSMEWPSLMPPYLPPGVLAQ